MRTGQRLTVGIGLVALALTACTDTGDGGADGGSSVAADTAGVALAQTVGPGGEAPVPGITVVGTGRVSGTPDTLEATLGVSVERPGVAEAVTEANRLAEAVIAAVVDAGVAEEDVQTARFSVEPRYEDRPTGGTPEIRAYVATNLVRIRITDVAGAGTVLSAAVEAGGDAARVQDVGFRLEDNAELLAAAREAAFAEARAKAEQYAELAGRDLGALVGVSEQLSDLPPVERFAAGSAAGSLRAAPVPLQPGQQEVAVHITATWSLS